MSTVRTWSTTLVMVALSACACSADRAASGPPVDVDANVPSKTVLALGGRESAGDGLGDRLRDAWPYRVFDALPRPTVFVNGARDDATVAHALAEQVPLARELRPDMVEVWLGADDVAARTPIRAFTSDFARLLGELRAAGARRILVADLPAVYGERTARYNDAIHRLVRDAGVELVPLARARIDQRVIADAFAAAIKSRP